MPVIVRRACADEAPELTAVAHASKRHWRYPERWISAWREQLTVRPELVRAHDVYVAAEGDEIAGFYALVADGDGLELEHLWVVPQRIGAGLGRLLFLHAVDLARRRGGRVLRVDADPNAEAFYVRMGCRRIGEVRADTEGQYRVLPRLELELAIC